MGAGVRIAILAAVTVAAVGALPAGAVAAPVTCGATITSDATLEADLECLFFDPISIGADRVTFDLNGHGIIGLVVVEGHDRVTIRDGAILGLQLRDAHRNRLLDLQVSEGGLSLTDSSRNLIKGNTSVSPFGPAIGLVRSDRNVIRGNQLHGAQAGLLFLDEASDRNAISGNTASASQAQAIAVGGSHNAIVGNTASASGNAEGIFPTEAIQIFGGKQNIVALNDVASDTDGILVTAAATRTIVAANTANGNGDDGIDVESARTTLWRNTANDNGDLGIEAVPGVRDAGGNRAARNGNPLQCLNVFCR